MIQRVKLAAALAVSVALYAPVIAAAQQEREYPVRIVVVPNSPVAITNCKATGFHSFTNVMNRTTRELLSVTIRWEVYDGTNTAIGNRTLSETMSQPIASGDSSVLPIWLGMELAEPMSAISFVTCRVMGATFTGRKTWTYGQKWPEKLLPIQAADLGSSEQSQAAPKKTNGAAPVSDLKFTVSNGWNDVMRGGMIVHDTLILTGGAADTTIRASNFALTMALANGAKKTYRGLMQAAPTYSKLNALTNQTITAYQVDPKSDFGALGSIIVPAHGAVTVTVSFAVEDTVADPNANREVAQQ